MNLDECARYDLVLHVSSLSVVLIGVLMLDYECMPCLPECCFYWKFSNTNACMLTFQDNAVTNPDLKMFSWLNIIQGCVRNLSWGNFLE